MLCWKFVKKTPKNPKTPKKQTNEGTNQNPLKLVNKIGILFQQYSTKLTAWFFFVFISYMLTVSQHAENVVTWTAMKASEYFPVEKGLMY